MIDSGLTLGAALLLGLAASGHCVVMCGGISAALGVATAKRADGRPLRRLLVAYQLGRISSYALAGMLLGGALGSLVSLLDHEFVRLALRALSAAALLLGALVAFGQLRDPGFRGSQRLWRVLAPLGRRLLPVRHVPGALGFGMIWGWMPCGFVYTVLLIATLQLDALTAGATMAAFGMGTAPALLAVAFGAERFARFTTRPAGRRVAGGMLLASAALTVAGPSLIAGMPWLHPLLPAGCAIP